MWEGEDLDGNPRILPGNSSWRVDMGAYEGVCPTYSLMVHIRLAAGSVRLIWTSQPGKLYAVLSSPDLLSGSWTEEAASQSEQLIISWSDPDVLSVGKFYRIEMKQ